MPVDSAVTDYISRQDASRRERLEQLHTLILDLYPDAVVDMAYKMPTYRHGEGWVALANQKHHLSLYTCASSHLEAIRKTCPTVKTGKGCINFRDRDEIDEKAVRQVVRHAIEHPKS